MAEELVMTINSNIKGVTKDTKELNDTLSEQKKILLELQQEEVALQQKRAKMTDYQRSLSGIDKQLEHLNLSIKDQKLAVKGLTEEQRESVKEQKQYNKQSKETIADFNVMGVSLNSVKKGFSQIIPTAKAMFGTIKAGIMSTGIGALVIAVVSLAQSFKRSEAGQEKFQRIMAAIGAVTDQVADAFADLGEIIIETFTDPLPAMTKFGKGLLKFLKDPTGATRDMFVKAALSAKGFVSETLEEVDALVEVTKMRQKAHHIERKLKVERAKANREIHDIRLQAEDRERFNATERIALLRKAQKIEEEITAKEIESKQLLIDAQVLEMEQGKNNIEQKDKLAQLEADLINLETKKLRSQRLLQTQITTAINQERADREALLDETTDGADKLIQADNSVLENYLSNNEKRKKSDEAMKVARLQVTSAIGGAVGALGRLMDEGSAAAKAAALAEIAINTGVGMVQGLNIAQKSAAAAGPGAALAFPLFYATQVAAVLGAAAQAKQILGAGGGGATSPSTTSPAAQTPAPQMMSGAFDISGGVAPEATRAYVVTDEMTNSQNQLANIRRRATI